jgi:hypothetical protein
MPVDGGHHFFKPFLAGEFLASCGWLGIHEAHLQAFGFSNLAGK